MERGREARLLRGITSQWSIHLEKKTSPRPSQCERNLHQHRMRSLHHARAEREQPVAPSIKNNAQPSPRHVNLTHDYANGREEAVNKTQNNLVFY